MTNNFGSNILVTGTSRGIGLEFVRQLSKLNDVKHIFAGCRNPSDAKELLDLQKAHPNVIPIKLDVQDDQTIENAYDQVSKTLGNEGLNLLINNAGVFETEGSYDNPKREAFQKTFDINSTGVAMVTAKFLPLVQKAAELKQRTIVANISSTGGSIGKVFKMTANNICYGMSKASLNYYTRLLSEYLKDSGIIFVALCPGWVRTDMGGQRAHLAPEDSISGLLRTISRLKIEDSGRYIDRNGDTIPF
uniref:Uncharacterized protein n=1 Tax=Acrobeloides nanus TaxID=290746 RepID=A0A914DP31_9BILA